MFIPVSTNLIKLAKLFPKPLYIVGGYVRNCLMDINGGDIDLACDMDIQDVVNLLKGTPYKTKVKNEKMFSLTISKDNEKYDFTSFRRDFYEAGGKHYPMKVERTHEIIEDAKRRDFTINAIYYSISKDEIIDYFHGVIDAKQKILRCIENPEDVFLNDGERILRLARIAGELDLKVEKKTFQVAKQQIKNISELSNGRRFTELEKILYCDKRYPAVNANFKKTLQLLNKLGIWKEFNLNISKIKYNMISKVDDRFLGLLIDIVDTVNPICMQTFLEDFISRSFDFSEEDKNTIISCLSGYYYALLKLANKEYFFRFYNDIDKIFPLLEKKSPKVAKHYKFFYNYIVRYNIPIKFDDLNIKQSDLKKLSPKASQAAIESVLSYLLGRVFDGTLENEKTVLIQTAARFIGNKDAE